MEPDSFTTAFSWARCCVASWTRWVKLAELSYASRENILLSSFVWSLEDMDVAVKIILKCAFKQRSATTMPWYTGVSLYGIRCAACPVHLIRLEFICLIILVMSSHITSSLFCPNTLLRILFSNILRLCSSISVRDQVSHPYKTSGRIIVKLLNLK
jgi:hypothetical protein